MYLYPGCFKCMEMQVSAVLMQDKCVIVLQWLHNFGVSPILESGKGSYVHSPVKSQEKVVDTQREADY